MDLDRQQVGSIASDIVALMIKQFKSASIQKRASAIDTIRGGAPLTLSLLESV